MDAAARYLYVTSVAGRSTDLYRGVNVDPATPRDASPAAPRSVVLAALRAVEGVVVIAGPATIVVSRGDAEDLRIHVDEDPVALPDLNLEGNPELAILVLDALVPVFGAMQLRDGDFAEIIDRTEPIADPVRRFVARARSIRLAIEATDDHADPPQVRRSRRVLTIAVVVAVAVAVPLVALWAFRTATRGAPLGALCAKNRQCESGECLAPPAADEVDTPNDGSPMMRARPAVAGGACTQPCRDDSECPAEMACADAVQKTAAFTTNIKRCMPRAWDTP